MGGNRDTQLLGEDAAARLLERRGLRITDRNWRCRMGEIDIVATDRDTLVFVEVKCRSGTALAEPFESVGFRKQARLRRLAEAYLVLRKPSFKDCRFDVVSVTLDENQTRVLHLVAAF